MNSSFKRILALILMMVSLLSCFTNAYADYSYNATVETTKNGNGGKLNMRESQSTNSNLVVRIPNGTIETIENVSVYFSNNNNDNIAVWTKNNSAYWLSSGVKKSVLKDIVQQIIGGKQHE